MRPAVSPRLVVLLFALALAVGGCVASPATPTAPPATAVPPTPTAEPPTATAEPPTATPEPPTATPEPPTPTPEPPTPTPADTGATLTPPDVETVAALVTTGACGGCHTIPGIERAAGAVGPNWCVPATKYQSGAVELDYLYQAITDPGAVVAEGFLAGLMPDNFGDLFTQEELDTLVAYIATLECSAS